MVFNFNPYELTLNKNDKVLVMQELDERPRIISHGVVSSVGYDTAVIETDCLEFVGWLPFYVVKVSDMIKVSPL